MEFIVVDVMHDVPLPAEAGVMSVAMPFLYGECMFRNPRGVFRWIGEPGPLHIWARRAVSHAKVEVAYPLVVVYGVTLYLYGGYTMPHLYMYATGTL